MHYRFCARSIANDFFEEENLDEILLEFKISITMYVKIIPSIKNGKCHRICVYLWLNDVYDAMHVSIHVSIYVRVDYNSR